MPNYTHWFILKVKPLYDPFLDIKPENVLITMNAEEIKKLAEDAILAGKTGKNLPGSAVCSSKRCFKKVNESQFIP
jgi:hypothetical protein